MIPFAALIVVALEARLVGLAVPVPYLDGWPASAAVGLAAAFALGASAHFREPRRSGLVSIVPPGLPRPELIVTVTGVLEIAGAVGLLIPALRIPAAIGLAILLVAVFPANVRAARGCRHPDAPTTPLPLRTIAQVGFLSACVVAMG
ncbi:hypothetical protein BFL34_01606 [Clavibacter michiganensis]|uniref:DoxX family membrane protein n=1 Tax=Clavibacter michiganensis TaxID=28447 RepID=A0A251Y9M8_9MICO|nr:hypothetical protein [Clavibacter michiganensis]OUE20788.1 hypothetical protein BFL34_01606 [Clavibacter michiganensis]